MTQENSTNPIADFDTWVIKYRSATYEQPLFFIWYTDTDEKNTDRLLTFTSGNIFATNSLKEIREIITNEIGNLLVYENLKPWLDHFKDAEPEEYCTYDITAITNSIEKKDLSDTTIEEIAKFISLYDDFIRQDERNNHLKAHVKDELIEKTWSYYYKFIFWPRFNDKEKFENWNKPQLVIDTSKLLAKFKEITKSFESNIHLA